MRRLDLHAGGRRSPLLAGLLVALLMVAPATAAIAHDNPTGQSVFRELARVRLATAQYRDVNRAGRHGYVEFLDCFDSVEGGMGQHYLDAEVLDGEVSATHPEVLVYEVTPRGLKLVGVEYVVPASFVDPENPPELFGQDFHLNADLDVWVQHDWVWKHNPSGMFADWNPRVGACPD
jgi:hypothetical protein